MRYSPQEIEVWYVLPEVRRQLAIELKSLGLSQKEVAGKLGVTAAAVSQYLSMKRGGNFSFSREVNMIIGRSAARIKQAKGRVLIMKEMQVICSAIRKDCTLCRIHRKMDSVPKDCAVCMGVK